MGNKKRSSKRSRLDADCEIEGDYSSLLWKISPFYLRNI